MEYFEREYILSKILCGYTLYEKDGLELVIKNPTPDVAFKANKIYMETLEEAEYFGIFTDEEMYSILLENELWTEKEEEDIGKMPKNIEVLQKQMFMSAYDTIKREYFRKMLILTKEGYASYYSKRHKFDTYTCHGAANQAKYTYIIENSTYLEGKKYNWEKESPLSVASYCNNNVITPTQIREIARTMPWVNMWQAAKANGSVFPVSGIELTSAQSLLLLWSKMYDNIHESPDCPPDNIIDDDDMLDGWLITQREKRESDKGQKAVDDIFNGNEKIKNASEVYLVASNAKDAEMIDSLNSSRAKAIKKQRSNTLFEKGTVRHQEFQDVQQQRLIDMNNAYNEHMRNRK